MQSFIALFLTYIFAVFSVNAAPVPQPQLGGLSGVTGLLSDPAAVVGEIVSTAEGLTGNLGGLGGLGEGLPLKRQIGALGDLSDPTSIIGGGIASLPDTIIGTAAGLAGGFTGESGGLLRRQLGDVSGIVSDPEAIAGGVVSTIEGLAGGLLGGGLGGGLIPKRQVAGLDIAAIPVTLLNDLGLSPVASVVASVEEGVEGAASGI